jgi:hypothetical protein
MNNYNMYQYWLVEQSLKQVVTNKESTQDIKDEYNSGIDLNVKVSE